MRSKNTKGHKNSKRKRHKISLKIIQRNTTVIGKREKINQDTPEYSELNKIFRKKKLEKT